jgi:hypothetical protein
MVAKGPRQGVSEGTISTELTRKGVRPAFQFTCCEGGWRQTRTPPCAIDRRSSGKSSSFPSAGAAPLVPSCASPCAAVPIPQRPTPVFAILHPAGVALGPKPFRPAPRRHEARPSGRSSVPITPPGTVPPGEGDSAPPLQFCSSHVLLRPCCRRAVVPGRCASPGSLYEKDVLTTKSTKDTKISAGPDKNSTSTFSLPALEFILRALRIFVVDIQIFRARQNFDRLTNRWRQ